MNKYTLYNNKNSVASLDINTFNQTPEYTAGHLYAKDPWYGMPYLVSPGRNLDVHYIYGVERLNHPDNSSRFGYARFPNGYGVGSWSPGHYNEPYNEEIQPVDMAPARFYGPKYQNPCHTESQGWKR